MKSLKQIKNNLLAEYIEVLETSVGHLETENIALLARLTQADYERHRGGDPKQPAPPTKH